MSIKEYIQGFDAIESRNRDNSTTPAVFPETYADCVETRLSFEHHAACIYVQ